MRDEILVPVSALVFAVFAAVCAWMCTWDMWTEGMSGLLFLCSMFSALGLIGCVLVAWDEQRNKY